MTATHTTSLAEIVDRPSWMNRAACRGHPPEWWFPQRGQSAGRALEICSQCPVLDQCREWAITEFDLGNHAAFGVCGGMTARARVRARRRTA